MGLFGKREKVIDWSEGYRQASSMKRSSAREVKPREEDNDAIGFLGNIANSSSELSTNSDISWDNEAPSQTVGDYQNKKQKLAKRLLEMTDKIEDLSNQIYHLKQRMEVIEKKLKISFS